MRHQPSAGGDTLTTPARASQQPVSEPPGPAPWEPDHDQDSEPPDTGYGERPEENSPDDFE